MPRGMLSLSAYWAFMSLTPTLPDHVTVESSYQLKNVAYKIYELAREIRKQWIDR